MRSLPQGSMFFSYFYGRHLAALNIWPYKVTMKKTILQYIFLICCITPFAAHAQSADNPTSIEKRKKELREKEEQRKAEEKAAIEEGKKQHLKIQEKQTRKRMRKSKKHSKKINDHKKDGFLKRLFTK